MNHRNITNFISFVKLQKNNRFILSQTFPNVLFFITLNITDTLMATKAIYVFHHNLQDTFVTFDVKP